MGGFINVKITSRSGKNVADVRVPEEATTEDLMSAIHDAKDRSRFFSPARQRLTLPPASGAKSGKPLGKNQTLGDAGITDGATVHLKDLGQQVGYMLVFFLEYFGPFLIYPFFWSRTGRELVYGIDPDSSPRLPVQDLACFYWCLHYAKRIFETFNVHKFSHGTMPIFNLFKNCSYYWAFAAFVSYFINHPLYTPPPLALTISCLTAAYFCQLGNLLSHLILAGLRKSPSDGYRIPRGFLFTYVTCANYTFEIWGWLLFAVATQSLPAALFAVCGAGQMIQWAIAKHKRLRKTFDGKEGREMYPRRWVILPPLL